ncbi:hypothetical protein M378DRAFT_361150 [Amanita muscaria Koide BX008]|uniref:Uncharacterized protein n=1 Tax=Amanita muscaria (strain Koide BX008) TaxID=946122 RepID=A0A0C2WM58_AMAMK|nr:hypothetical protein M378DRAFT_361150 [Amanita muscaria Koide BX008]
MQCDVAPDHKYLRTIIGYFFLKNQKISDNNGYKRRWKRSTIPQSWSLTHRISLCYKKCVSRSYVCSLLCLLWLLQGHFILRLHHLHLHPRLQIHPRPRLRDHFHLRLQILVHRVLFGWVQSFQIAEGSLKNAYTKGRFDHAPKPHPYRGGHGGLHRSGATRRRRQGARGGLD